MEQTGNKGNPNKAYLDDLEEISSMLTYIQSILSQLKRNNENKRIYQLDPVQIRKDNEILKKGLLVLGKVINVTL